MKLRRLLLTAFGPFTDVVLDFTPGPDGRPGLHIVYGPNEAGKSSALRAMGDLRFGIPVRSADDFIHATSDMRIGGVFEDAGGNDVALVRRKGRGQTLSRLDRPGTEAVRADEEALTAGLTRDAFESMFGLNHARLREGGRALVRGEGELGSALFEASAGTRGIAQLLARLDDDAKAQYNPNARAQSAVINEARRQFDEARRALRESQVRPAEWQERHRTHQAALAALEASRATVAQLRREEAALAELRAVAPIVAMHDRCASELAALADVPDLDETASRRREQAEQAAAQARADLVRIEAALAECRAALAGLGGEPALVAATSLVERLVTGSEALARTRVEVLQARLRAEHLAGELARRAARLDRTATVEAVLARAPSAADRSAILAKLDEAARVRLKLASLREQLAVHESVAEADPANAGILDPQARASLMQALDAAQALGNVLERVAALDGAVRQAAAGMAQRLHDLALPTIEALRAARPLLDADIAAARDEHRRRAERIASLREEDAGIARDLHEQSLRHARLAATGEVVTAATLAAARDRRDTGWRLVRFAWEAGHGEGSAVVREFAGTQSLAAAFEAAQSAADRQADLLRTDAERAAIIAECAKRIDDMTVRRAQIERDLAALARERSEAVAAWQDRLAAAGLPALTPEALGEWQSRRIDALLVDERIAVDRDASAQLASAADVVAMRLHAALGAPGASKGDRTGLAALIQRGLLVLQAHTRAEAALAERERTARVRERDRARLASEIDAMLAAVEVDRAVLRQWCDRLGIDARAGDDAIRAQLDGLADLVRQSAELAEVRARAADAQAAVDAIERQANDLAGALGEAMPGVVEHYIEALRERLAAATRVAQARANLERDAERLNSGHRAALASLADAQEALRVLCEAAGVMQAEALPEIEGAAIRKRALRSRLADLRDQLVHASTQGIEALRERLGQVDSAGLDVGIERCRASLQIEETRADALRQAEELARRALEAIDSSDRAAVARASMEAAAARIRGALRPWARLRLAHTLLGESLRRFRERAQAPMLASASRYFATMTGGRYVRLLVDDADDKPVLLADREDGARIGLAAMSEGTADQLYLALRLAALDLRRSSHLAMPLVLDDVLITSDDIRAANVLRALAAFAQGTQVLLFTHHRHLIEVARGALPPEAFAIHSLDGAGLGNVSATAAPAMFTVAATSIAAP